MKEIIISTYTAEEAEAIAETEIKNLEQRLLMVDNSEKPYISDIILQIKKQLKTYLDNLNN